MPDLDNRLARSRAALLDQIDQPPLADVRRRARGIRRRRAAAAGATVLALLGVIGLGTRPWQHDTTPSVTATVSPSSAPVYRGGDIKITGLLPDPVLSLEGEIADVEFTDRDHGLAAVGCDKACPPLASTADGGLRWQEVAQSPSGDGPTDVIAFPGGSWLLHGADLYWASADGARWSIVTPPAETTRAAIGPGELLRVDQPAGQVSVINADRGPLGPLAHQPDLTARWVAPAPTADGAWWVGGLHGTAPAVAVSHDAGRSWKTTTLPAPVDPTDAVAISTLGSEVYAVARSEAGEVLGIYHSADSGGSFEATYRSAATGGAQTPRPFAGDPVPLLDGRLLLVQPNGTPSSWWVSADAGRTFTPVVGLPAVGLIRRSYSGYVAYRLFDSWTAFSTDGSNWQKLQVY